jgi:ribosomal protein S18 acetylase RimI-like enzyme
MIDNVETKVYESGGSMSSEDKLAVATFLYKHLDEYGDPLDDILKSIEYATNSVYGGKVLTAQLGTETCGAVILNNTGMVGYIPETILVYIAVHENYRGKGIGKLLMKKAIEETNGNIALHVEEDNPAKFLYEKVGFSKKYAEMRYIR